MTVKFRAIEPDEIENTRVGPRGRVSYPILKGFMDSQLYAAEVDLTESKRKAATLYVLLKSYIGNHDLPIKPVMRRGKLYLLRLDIDEKGNQIENWRELNDPVAQSEFAATEGVEISPEEVAKRV